MPRYVPGCPMFHKSYLFSVFQVSTADHGQQSRERNYSNGKRITELAHVLINVVYFVCSNHVEHGFTVVLDFLQQNTMSRLHNEKQDK